MANIDIFNGDADGICALAQLRLANPRDSQLITGVKRDISLVGKANITKNDDVTVLDVSFDKNREAVIKALPLVASLFYVDHHYAGDIPSNDKLTTLINPAADICTSLLVNSHLQGAHPGWAAVGAFGDNLDKGALSLCRSLKLDDSQVLTLKNLGIYINYNGYGSAEGDLHFHPADLYQKVVKFENPLDFVQSGDGCYTQLESGYQADMSNVTAVKADYSNEHVKVMILPNAAWARRVSGVYSNDLANQSPNCAHAVLTEKEQGGFVVSVRAPLNNKTGADTLCRSFDTGGGRAAAAGINHLPADKVTGFIEQFSSHYQKLSA